MVKFSPIRLRELRQRAELSRTALAFAINRDSDTVRDYERGRIAPSAGVLGVLADTLGCSVADFFEDVTDA